PAVIRLDDEDFKHIAVTKRLNAVKALAETTKCDLPGECATFVEARHQNGTLTLVITNTVGRAQEIWTELKNRDIDAKLLHSRYRPCDRKGIVDDVLAAGSGVIVATQVIEAGVDINADLMITDAAPWASMVQRFGRVNRDGNKPHARIYWVRN